MDLDQPEILATNINGASKTENGPLQNQSRNSSQRKSKCIRKGNKTYTTETEEIIVRSKVPSENFEHVSDAAEVISDSIHSGESLFKNFTFEQCPNESDTNKCIEFWKKVMEKNLNPIKFALIKSIPEHCCSNGSNQGEITPLKKEKGRKNHKSSIDSNTNTIAKAIFEELTKKNLQKMIQVINPRCETCNLLSSIDKGNYPLGNDKPQDLKELDTWKPKSTGKVYKKRSEVRVKETATKVHLQERSPEIATQTSQIILAKPSGKVSQEISSDQNVIRHCSCSAEACTCKHDLQEILYRQGMKPCSCGKKGCVCKDGHFLTLESSPGASENNNTNIDPTTTLTTSSDQNDLNLTATANETSKIAVSRHETEPTDEVDTHKKPLAIRSKQPVTAATKGSTNIASEDCEDINLNFYTPAKFTCTCGFSDCDCDFPDTSRNVGCLCTCGRKPCACLYGEEIKNKIYKLEKRYSIGTRNKKSKINCDCHRSENNCICTDNHACLEGIGREEPKPNQSSSGVPIYNKSRKPKDSSQKMLINLKEVLLKETEKEVISVSVQCDNIDPVELRERKYCYICGHYDCPCEVRRTYH